MFGRMKKAFSIFAKKKVEMYPSSASFVSTETFYQPWHRGHAMIDKSILTSVMMRIANEVAGVRFMHCKVDANGGLVEELKTGLNDCLNYEANIDQTGAEMIREAVAVMFESRSGDVAIVPTYWDENDKTGEIEDYAAMRVGTIVRYGTMHVVVNVYNDKSGQREDITVDKRRCVIIQNPLYEIINAPNSTALRLSEKLSAIDIIDSETVSGRLNMIVQLPYKIAAPQQQKLVKEKMEDLSNQLKTSRYGIAWTDNVDKIIQLNRPLDNNLQSQVEYLTKSLYSQLGISEEILANNASEQALLNFYNTSIMPILSAFKDNLNRKLISPAARQRGEAIIYSRDPFKLVPTNQIADIADKFTRNEILAPNEIRAIVGFKPSADPKADELRNRNINQAADGEAPPVANKE